MKNILNNIKAQQKLDPENLYNSIIQLNKQCHHAFKDADKIKVVKKPIKNLIMSGMGGSGLAARVIESLYKENLKVPLIRINDYYLPKWADKTSLVVISSYSGTTEETVQVLKRAIVKNCQILVICAGGILEKLALKHKLPMYKINPKYNLSQQPRMAIGYSIIGQIIMIAKVGLINITKKELTELKSIMLKIIKTNQREINLSNNPAKKLANAIHSKQLIMVASQHLTGALHVVKNQMNENAKQLSHRHDIPELNHHLMEGLKFPDSNKKDVVFWIINSMLYSKRIQTRMVLTMDVVNKNKINAFEFLPMAKTKLAQVFEVIQFGAFVNYYLTILNKINPAPIPWVDYFKKKLGQPLGDFK
ncbi:MAG: SIS domain-containing protein [Patescibacteria group bacterium]|nr:SIS domain-containing protein [Patescibacteria group bacterium]